jgi:fatty acid desaturase
LAARVAARLVLLDPYPPQGDTAMSPVELLPRWKSSEEDESTTHFYAHEGKVVFRWMIRFLVIITIIMMMIPVVLYFAWIPATLLVVFYGIRLLINTVEGHTGLGRARKVKREQRAADAEPEAVEVPAVEAVERRATAAPPAEAAPRKERASEPVPEPAWKHGDFSAKLLRHEAKLIAAVILVVFVIAVIIGFSQLGWKLLVLSVPVVFAYILLLGWPVWFAAMEEDAEQTESDESEVPSSASSRR